jgi:anthranilate phosphoribosyltransferase
VAELKNGEICEFEISPEDAGLERVSLEDLKGKDPEYNAKALIEAISGIENAYRNAVVYNAAAGLVISGKATDLKDGVNLAKQAIDSSAAHKVLMKLAEISNC